MFSFRFPRIASRNIQAHCIVPDIVVLLKKIYEYIRSFISINESFASRQLPDIMFLDKRDLWITIVSVEVSSSFEFVHYLK